MKTSDPYSRRDFVKVVALATTALAGSTTLSACTPAAAADLPLRQWLKPGVPDGPVGLLFSQVGYEEGLPVRVVMRLPQPDLLADTATCWLRDGRSSLRQPLRYWGPCWGAHWWVAEFAGPVGAGVYDLEVREGDTLVYADTGLEVRQGILWEETIPYASVDMLERRLHFTKVGAGWQDAGTLWVESCAQSAMIISLTDLLEGAAAAFEPDFTDRLEKQVTVGCDYLIMTQQKARELGYPEGAFCHDLHGHEHDILPHDASKAVVALLRASRLLSDAQAEKRQVYRQAAEKAYRWLVTTARPLGAYGFHRFQRGLPPEAAIPPDEWVTRDLVMMCWAALEMWKVDPQAERQAQCLAYAQQVMARQIGPDQAEAGFYGHFYEFASLPHSESAWVHGIVPTAEGVQFGTDLGGFYPHYLLPVIEMLRLWPAQAEAPQWRAMLQRFVEGYLKPACAANPFWLAPLGIFGEEGPIWFGGTFHGSNAIYGYTAALALELASLLEDAALVDIALGNLMWIAGLNSGITAEALQTGSVVFSADVPAGLALPASMICHIGRRWAGTWFQTRGVICNGFSVGEQFKYDTPPTQALDGPHSFTDEDWIPHSAAWVAGLVRLQPFLPSPR